MGIHGLRVLAPLLVAVAFCVAAGLYLSDREVDPGTPAAGPDEAPPDDPPSDVAPPPVLPEASTESEPSPPMPPPGDLWPAHVRGTVLDQGGVPVEGARIALLSPNLDWRAKVPIAAVTGAGGRFDAGHDGKAAVKRLVVDATSQGYFVEERLLDLLRLGSDAEVTVRVEKGRVIAGRAVDRDGNPLAGAAVHFTEIRADSDLEDPGARRPLEGHVETDADGRFSDDGYRRGIYRACLTGEIDGHKFAVVKEGVEAGDSDVELRFMGFGKRRFTFEDEETREPVSVTEVAVDLIYANTGEEERFVPWAEFNNRTEIELGHLPQGHYRLRLVHPGYDRVLSEIFFVEAGSDPGEICYRLHPE